MATTAARYAMTRPVGLGLAMSDIEELAGRVRDETRSAVDAWEARFVRRGRDSHVNVEILADAMGRDRDVPVTDGPWEGDRSFVVVRHDGRWSVRHLFGSGGSVGDAHRLAMAVGIRAMHWAAQQATDPGCWVFAKDSVGEPPEVRLAIREAIHFADALLVRDADLEATLRRWPHDAGMVVGALRAPLASVERRMARLGLAKAWMVPGADVPGAANDAA